MPTDTACPMTTAVILLFKLIAVAFNAWLTALSISCSVEGKCGKLGRQTVLKGPEDSLAAQSSLSLPCTSPGPGAGEHQRGSAQSP
eukprot:scaffold1298_cov382-Prasinococcus_capsulatus_cf.AAC.16